MTVTTQKGNQTIDPPIPSVVEKDIRKDKEVVETSGELVDHMVIYSKVSHKVVPIHRPPPPFPHRLVEKSEDGKYHRFITMLKQLSIMSLW